MYYGGGLLVLILDIYAMYLILNSSANANQKLLWLIIVVVLPILGPILYLLLGRGGNLV
jgi:Phospholipase_D-nuclease N-terminal